MEWRNKRVFISGGNGVIGRELAAALHSRGADIFIGDLKPYGNELPKGIRYRQGDLNLCRPEELLEFQPEYFFHLAATFERSVETYEFWEENYWHNIRLSHHLLSILKDAPCLKRIIFASSYLIYDQNLYQFEQPQDKAFRLKETDDIHPRNLTGMAKLMHEMEISFIEEFNRSRVSAVMPRIFRVYGKGSRDVISRWTRQLLQGEEVLRVYRKEGMFDYIYAGEVAEGLLRLAASDYSGVINLGRDHARSVAEVVEAFKEYFPAMQAEECESNIAYEASQADMSLFEKITGWRPEIEIEEGIKLLLTYERNTPPEDRQAGNILITSAAKKVPLLESARAAARKLDDGCKIAAGDSNSTCIAQHFADAFWQMPPLAELTDATLLSALKKQDIAFVIPSRDGELAYWSERRQLLADEGVHVMVSSPDAVEACLDKLLFYQKYSALGLPVIETATDIESLSCDIFVVKERYGAGALNLGLALSKEEAIAHAAKLSDPIFQPYVRGREYSVDAYIDKNGEVKGLICRSRDFVVNGESQVTTTVHHPRMEECCKGYIAAMALYGHVVLQLLADNEGDFWLIECNPRFGGASTLSLAAGLDSFYWFLVESRGGNLADYPFRRTMRELRQIRHACDRVVAAAE